MRSAGKSILVLTGSITVLVVAGLWLDYTVDDAFISFRYARNLVEGHGLSFNPGEPRVEGYTNFLWTLLMAGVLAKGLDPVLLARAMGLVSGAVVLVVAERLARRVAPGNWSILVPVLLVLNPGFVVWSAAGLETSFFTALVVLGAWLATRQNTPRWAAGAAGVALGLACLTRPEGLLAAALIGLGVLLAEGRDGLRRLWPTFAIVALVFASHELWRISYYGSWFPNTFYLRTGDLYYQARAGFNYVQKGWLFFAGGPFALLLVALGLKRRDATSTVAATLFLGWSLYLVGVGGDGMPMFRFLVPVLPFLALLVSRALGLAVGGRALVAPAVLLGAFAWTLLPALQGRERVMIQTDRKFFVPTLVSVGQALGELVEPGASIALMPAGAVPYYSRLPTIDMLGVNDPVISRRSMKFVQPLPGHWKYDAAEVLARRPDYILLGNVDVTEAPRAEPIPVAYLAERELVDLAGFSSSYEQTALRLPDGRWLNCYRRREH